MRRGRAPKRVPAGTYRSGTRCPGHRCPTWRLERVIDCAIELDNYQREWRLERVLFSAPPHVPARCRASSPPVPPTLLFGGPCAHDEEPMQLGQAR